MYLNKSHGDEIYEKTEILLSKNKTVENTYLPEISNRKNSFIYPTNSTVKNNENIIPDGSLYEYKSTHGKARKELENMY